jgi:alpha-amylase/alpha-mannosidase (GH57 family)
LERYICIHGHFYQPPRENPWLEAIELQDSAYPYHDWNERITAECYAPNSASRILDPENRIDRIVNNYASISFNFGPTLLTWLQLNAPRVYRGILAADEESSQKFSGHGSAMAQAYNHIILPLANSRDKQAQVLWGVRDFEARFGRKPEGMWLPETAVDLETLEILAGAGIRFTVLSPYQAIRTRACGGRSWRDVKSGRVDPSMPYLLRLKSGATINLFFYDGPISRAVAFENLLERGENLANRLAGAFSDKRTWPQLVHMATDGETYGNHRPHADMALAYALHYIEEQGIAKLTNYGEFLECFPPTHEAEIVENSSWSCVHGVERWRSDCGCNSGGHAGWNQQWRAPLREALDELRDHLASEFELRGGELFAEPWRARDAYIDVILDRSQESVERFLATHARRPLSLQEQTAALKLLEIQRHAMLMYTSCGWFFDELSGIETVQVIQYAGRALQLAEELDGGQIEVAFLDKLASAKSNIAEQGDGRKIFEKITRPAEVDLQKVGAHYAISSLFEKYEETTTVFCYEVRSEAYQLLEEGARRLALGRVRVASTVTRESELVSFGVLHLGDQNFHGGVRSFSGEEAYVSMAAETAEAFQRGDLAELIRAVDRNFGSGTFSLRSLFRDEQRRIVDRILDKSTAEASALYRQFYTQYGTLIRYVADLEIPLSAEFQMAVEFALHERLLETLSRERPNPERVKKILQQVEHSKTRLHMVTLEFAFRRTVERAAQRFLSDPSRLDELSAFVKVAEICSLLPFEVNLWYAQNIFFEVMENTAGRFAQRAEAGDEEARSWLAAASSLGEKLSINPNRLAGKVLS